MSIPRPRILLNFVNAPEHYLDPRLTLVRATTGTTMTSTGQHKVGPSNTLRYYYKNGVAQGALIEASRTNLILRSQEFENASWTATNATVTANSTTSPDGTANADTISVTGASGAIAQAVAVTAGNYYSFTAYFKPLASQHSLIRIYDGTSTITAWFNVSAGTKGTQSGTAGNLTYGAHEIEEFEGGWYRCHFTVLIAVVASVTVSLSASSADNTEPASGQSVYGWGAQAELGRRATSYIPTTSATVTRNGDQLSILTSAMPFFDYNEGAFIYEWTQSVGGSLWDAYVLGGIAAAFGENVYLSYGTDGALRSIISTGGSVGFNGFVAGGNALANGSINKIAVSWKANDFKLVFNGTTYVVDTSGAVPPSPARLAFGGSPWTGTIGAQPNCPVRGFSYYNESLSLSSLLTLTKV